MKYLEKFPIIGQLLQFTKKHSFPGFKGISIFSIFSFVFKEAQNDDIYTRANSIAFSFFLAIFPALIVLFTLIPLIPGTSDFILVIKDSTKEIIPVNAHQYLFEIVDGVANTQRDGLRFVGAIMALIFASSGMLTLMAGFDKNYEAFAKRSFIKKRLIAIYLTLLLTALLLFSFILIVFGKQMISLGIDYLNFQPYASETFIIARIIGISLIFYLGITLVYRLGPSLINRVPFWNIGAIVATLFSIVSSFGFAYFVNSFGRYNEIYGSIGALIVIMIWLQINAYIIIIGFELNASIAVVGGKQRTLKSD